MKRLAAMLALVSFLAVPALADQTGGGIAGTVTNIATGQPIQNATILYYKAPYLENGPNQIHKLQTNSKGYFSDITLEPGRYIIMARVPDKVLGCAVDDVMGGEISHVKIEIGRDRIVCSGPRVHPTLIDPNATASLYRI